MSYVNYNYYYAHAQVYSLYVIISHEPAPSTNLKQLFTCITAVVGQQICHEPSDKEAVFHSTLLTNLDIVTVQPVQEGHAQATLPSFRTSDFVLRPNL